MFLDDLIIHNLQIASSSPNVLQSTKCTPIHANAKLDPGVIYYASNSLPCHSSTSLSVVSPVVPQTCQSSSFQPAHLRCTTTYSTTFFSFPLPVTISNSSFPLTFRHLVSFCRLHILTTAC